MMETEAFETIEYKGHQIKLYVDEDPPDPREWDNSGIMICFHGAYVSLGDKKTFSSDEFNGWDDMKRHFVRVEGAVEILPVYMYDHSGITISTKPFPCHWDSGQIGFIYATRKSVEGLLGIKRITPSTRKRIREALEGEVEAYDKYLRGDYCGFVIEGECANDSCWGFEDAKYAIEEAKTCVNYSTLHKDKKGKV